MWNLVEVCQSLYVEERTNIGIKVVIKLDRLIKAK